MASATTEAELVEAQRILALVQAKKVAEDNAEAALAAAADATPASARVKALAVQIHTLLCTLDHSATPGGTCSWFAETAPNDPVLANWSQTAHALWLARARSGIKSMLDLGFTVTDP